MRNWYHISAFILLVQSFIGISLSAAESELGPDEEEGTLEDFERDFSKIETRPVKQGDWRFGAGVIGGFEAKKAVAGVLLRGGYETDRFGATFRLPVVAHEKGRQKDTTYTVERLSMKDTLSPDGYDYLDEGTDVLWYFDRAYYNGRTDQAAYYLTLQREDDVNFGYRPLIHNWSFIGYHAAQNKKSLHVDRETDNSNLHYINDDFVNLDFHGVYYDVRPIPEDRVFGYWKIGGMLYYDTDPLDFRAEERLADPSRSSQQYLGGAFTQSMPVYIDVGLILSWESAAQFILRDGELYGAELQTGLGWKIKGFEVEATGLYLVDNMPRTPLFSPFFDVTRLEIGRNRVFDSGAGVQVGLYFFWTRKWSGYIRNRTVAGADPYYAFGFRYAGKDDPLTIDLGWYRRYAANFRDFISTHKGGNGVTRFLVGYEVFYRLDVDFTVYVEPLPPNSLYAKKAQTQATLTTTYIF